MSFFDLPPPSAPPPGGRIAWPPSWSGPPANVLGRLVEDRVVLYRAESVLVCLEHLRAYPRGFEFRISTRVRGQGVTGVAGGVGVQTAMLTATSGMPVAIPPGPWGHPLQQPLNLGLAEADGTRLTNVSPVVGVGSSPEPPLLVQLGSHYVPGLIAHLYWHWGLPAEGPLGVVVESAMWNVPETRVDIDAEVIRRAASEAEVLWEVDEVGTSVLGGPFRPWPPSRLIFAPDPVDSGERPADEAAARREIEAAFAGLATVENGGLVNVEAGGDLGPTMALVQQRVGGMSMNASLTVDRVAFISATEATVWFSVWLGGGSQFLRSTRGRAVVQDGRWKIGRDTFCGLIGQAGVPCPER